MQNPADLVFVDKRNDRNKPGRDDTLEGSCRPCNYAKPRGRFFSGSKCANFTILAGSRF
jgi:hypothetical protein